MGDDRTGLLGEHGPEAVIPLRGGRPAVLNLGEGRLFVASLGTAAPESGSVEYEDDEDGNSWPIPGTEKPPPPVEWVEVGDVVAEIRSDLYERTREEYERMILGDPGRPSQPLTGLLGRSARFELPPMPEWTFDADAAREAFDRIGRGFQALTVSFRMAGLEFERTLRLLFGTDLPRTAYVRRIRSDYRRKSRARARRGRH